MTIQSSLVKNKLYSSVKTSAICWQLGRGGFAVDCNFTNYYLLILGSNPSSCSFCLSHMLLTIRRVHYIPCGELTELSLAAQIDDNSTENVRYPK